MAKARTKKRSGVKSVTTVRSLETKQGAKKAKVGRIMRRNVVVKGNKAYVLKHKPGAYRSVGISTGSSVKVGATRIASTAHPIAMVAVGTSFTTKRTNRVVTRAGTRSARGPARSVTMHRSMIRGLPRSAMVTNKVHGTNHKRKGHPKRGSHGQFAGWSS